MVLYGKRNQNKLKYKKVKKKYAGPKFRLIDNEREN